MKRRGFLKSLGIGAGAILVAPALLTTSEGTAKDRMLAPPKEPIVNGKYPGINRESFTMKFSDKFKPGDVLTNDPEFGQQVIVIDSDNFPEHEVKLVTNSRSEYFLPQNLAEGIKYFKISHFYPGEYGTNYSGKFTVMTTYTV